MHSLEMIQRMNSATVSNRIRRRAIILNQGGGHAKDAEKGRGAVVLNHPNEKNKAWLKASLAFAVAEKKKWPKWARGKS